MELFPVYSLYDIELVKGKGCCVYDKKGNEYLDLYGGHAVISVGHAHPDYVRAVTRQMKKLAYYSNSVKLPIQSKLARKLGEASGCGNYALFLCNSGAEANENAIKLASFQTGRKMIIAFSGSFHGRTHGAVAVTDNASLRAPVNTADHVVFLPLNHEDELKAAFAAHAKDIAAVIIEPVQGVGGIRIATAGFLKLIEQLCREYGAMFIADEVQSGFGRTGKFFSFQHADVKPNLITVAKGMGNGFPIGGVLIAPGIRAESGMLGTTFGGNPLACAAGIAVLDIIEEENLVRRSHKLGDYFMEKLGRLHGVKEVRGQGLMIGVELEGPASGVRRSLLMDHMVFTGNSSMPDVIRFLPPLTISKKQIDHAVRCLERVLSAQLITTT